MPPVQKRFQNPGKTHSKSTSILSKKSTPRNRKKLAMRYYQSPRSLSSSSSFLRLTQVFQPCYGFRYLDHIIRHKDFHVAGREIDLAAGMNFQFAETFLRQFDRRGFRPIRRELQAGVGPAEWMRETVARSAAWPLLCVFTSNSCGRTKTLTG